MNERAMRIIESRPFSNFQLIGGLTLQVALQF